MTRAVETHPTSTRLWAMLAEAHKNAGRPAQAVEILTEAMTLCAEKAILQMQLGEAHIQLHDWPKAAEAFIAAAEAFDAAGSPPKVARALLRAARCYFLSGDYNLAEKHVNRAAKLAGTNEQLESLQKLIAAKLNPPQAASAPAPLF